MLPLVRLTIIEHLLIRNFPMTQQPLAAHANESDSERAQGVHAYFSHERARPSNFTSLWAPAVAHSSRKSWQKKRNNCTFSL